MCCVVDVQCLRSVCDNAPGVCVLQAMADIVKSHLCWMCCRCAVCCVLAVPCLRSVCDNAPGVCVLQAMADIVKSHLQTGKVCTPQLTLRCPMCTNATCGMAKEFFASQQSLLDELLFKSSQRRGAPPSS